MPSEENKNENIATNKPEKENITNSTNKNNDEITDVNTSSKEEEKEIIITSNDENTEKNENVDTHIEHAEEDESMIYEELPNTGDNSRMIISIILISVAISIITFIFIGKRMKK